VYQDFEIAYNPAKSAVESSTAARRQAVLPTVKGTRIISDTEIEVYVDYWFPEDSMIADYATMWTDLSQTGNTGWAWEVMLAMDEVVFTDKAAMYSDTAAETFGVSWFDVVVDADARLVYDKLGELAAADFFPENVFTRGDTVYATPADAMARYTAAMAWFDDHGHMVIGNGPFMLTTFDAAAGFAQLDAFRDPTYPFKPGDFWFGWPEEIDIVDVAVEDVTTGQAAVFTAELMGPGTLTSIYLVINPETGAVLRSGDAVEIAPGSFEIKLPRDFTYLLEPGTYELVVAGISDETAFVSERREVFEASAPPVGVQTVTVVQTETVGAATVTQTQTQTVGATTVTTTKTETVTQPDYLWVAAAAIVALLIGAAGGWFFKKK
jgi:peptide/nickel transport system substrate-binding protein